MFVFQGKLDHLLPTLAYHDPNWFERERREIFANSWNCIGLARDVAKPGDRFACEVAGVPMVVWNHEGKLRAMSNVCGHRHSLIAKTGKSCGHVLKCQIHGWEYDPDGHLTKIPDGKHFKVVKAGDFSLNTFRVEQVGPFVFVNLSADGPSFDEHLGNMKANFHRYYDDLRLVDVWTTEHAVNWKIACENGVESYHVPTVHPTTYEDHRDEELHDHELAPTFTRYGDLLPYSAEMKLESLGFRLYTHLLIKKPNYRRFTHVHLFPNIMLYYGDIFSGLSVIEPLGPEKMRFTSYSFVPRDVYWGWIGRRVQDLSMVLFLRMGRKILREDMVLWPPVQRGLKSSGHSGVLSAREERVYAFQKFVSGIMEPAKPIGA
jgi:choline monooxygenase